MGVFAGKRPIVLASASPRRSELLASLGLEFTVAPSAVEEPQPDRDETPAAYAIRMAALKTADVAARHPDAVVIGADTIVVLGDAILGKPKNACDALRMLSLLSGKQHEVTSGCCVIKPGCAPATFAVSTKVTFIDAPREALRAYIETGEPMDKAGAYAIQGQGAFLIETIEGSYTNVVGLPLARVLEVLVSWRVIVPRQG